MALESDLADGLTLIALVEVLSGKRLPKHNKRANLKAQKLENINIALKFLQVEEKIKIVNIGNVNKLYVSLRDIVSSAGKVCRHERAVGNCIARLTFSLPEHSQCSSR